MIRNGVLRVFRYETVVTLLAVMLVSVVPTVGTNPVSDRLAHPQTVTFDLYVQDAVNMYGYQLKVEYNPKELEFVASITGQEGYFLYDLSSMYDHSTVHTCKVFSNTEPQHIIQYECILGWIGAQASGSGKLCSITFRKLVSSNPVILVSKDKKDTFYVATESRDRQPICKPLSVSVELAESRVAGATTTPNTLTNNDSLTFSIDVENVVDMYGWQIKLEFDAEELEFLEFITGQEGYFLHDFTSEYRRQTAKAFQVLNENESAYILACEWIPDGFDAQASGNGRLCSIKFRKLAVASNPTIKLLEDSQFTYYISMGGPDYETEMLKPMPAALSLIEP